MPAGWFQVGGKPVFSGDDGLVRLKNFKGEIESVAPAQAHEVLGDKMSGYSPATADDINTHHAELDRQKRVDAAGLGGKVRVAGEAALTGAIDAATAIPRVAARAILPEADANAAEEKVLSGRAVLSNLRAIAGEAMPGPQTGEAVAHRQDEASRALAQDQPGLATGGRIAGELGGSLLMPGGGLTGAAEAGAAQAGLGAFGRAATRIGAFGAEAGAAGSTQATEDAWVGNVPLTAEAAAAGAMKGFLYGAAGGAALSGAGAAAGRLRKVFGRPGTTAPVTKASDEAVGQMLGDVVGAEAQPGAVSWVRGHAKRLGQYIENRSLAGKAPEEVAAIRKTSPFSEASAERDRIDHVLHNYDDVVNEATTHMRNNLNELSDESDKVRELWDSAALKEESIRPKITTNHPEALEAARGFAARAREDVDALVARAESEVGSQGNKGANTSLRKTMGRLASTIENTEDPAQAFTAVYQMKQAIQKTKMRYANTTNTSVDAGFAKGIMDPGLDAIQRDAIAFTQNQGVWGEAGKVVEDTNRLYSEMLRKKEVFDQTVMNVTERRAWDGPKQVAWDEKIRPFLEKLSTGQNVQREEYVRQYVSGLRDLSDTLGTHFDVPAETLTKVRGHAEEALGTIDRMKADIGSANQLRAAGLAEKNAHGPSLGAAAMAALTGTTAEAGQGAAGWALNKALGGQHGTQLGSATMALQAAHLRALSSKVSRQAATLTEELVKPVERALRPVNTVRLAAPRVGRAARAAAVATAGAQTAQSTERQYRQVAERVVALQNDPEAMQDAIAHGMGPEMPAFPQTSTQIASTHARATSFLANKIPAPLKSGGGLTPLRASDVAPAQMSRFNRYVEAVEDPVGALRKVGDGSITSEHVEAIKAVYPAMYSMMQEAVTEQVLNGKADAPYQVRLRLEKMFGLKLEPTNAPSFAAFIQQSAAASGTQQQKPRHRGSKALAPISPALSQGAPNTTRI